MTALATVFDWQLIYGKSSAEKQRQRLLCLEDGGRKENDVKNRKYNAVQYTIGGQKLQHIKRSSLVQFIFY